MGLETIAPIPHTLTIETRIKERSWQPLERGVFFICKLENSDLFGVVWDPVPNPTISL
jgi:hypothetical protein